jgi:hypothetical protein
MSSLVDIHLVNNRNISFEARLSILIPSKINRRVITTSPNSRHERLFGWWSSFAEKQQRVGPYFKYFSTNSN